MFNVKYRNWLLNSKHAGDKTRNVSITRPFSIPNSASHLANGHRLNCPSQQRIRPGNPQTKGWKREEWRKYNSRRRQPANVNERSKRRHCCSYGNMRSRRERVFFPILWLASERKRLKSIIQLRSSVNRTLARSTR